MQRSHFCLINSVAYNGWNRYDKARGTKGGLVRGPIQPISKDDQIKYMGTTPITNGHGQRRGGCNRGRGCIATVKGATEPIPAPPKFGGDCIRRESKADEFEMTRADGTNRRRSGPDSEQIIVERQSRPRSEEEKARHRSVGKFWKGKKDDGQNQASQDQQQDNKEDQKQSQQNQENQPNNNNGQGQNDPNNPNNGNNPQNSEQGNEPSDEDRDEGELPEELLETLRQAERLLDALKTDEKPLGAIEAERGKRGRSRRQVKKNW